MLPKTYLDPTSMLRNQRAPGTFVPLWESEAGMFRQILPRIGIYLVCGILLFLAFEVIGTIYLPFVDYESYPLSTPIFLRLLPLMLLPILGLVIYLRNERWASKLRKSSLTAPGPQPGNLHSSREPSRALPDAPPEKWWAAGTLWIGIVLLLIGSPIFLSAHHWMATHTFVAFDGPITFAGGHASTGDFYINLNADYSVEINVDDKHPGKDCRTGGLVDEVVLTRWLLSRDGKVTDEVLINTGHSQVLSPDPNLDGYVMSNRTGHYSFEAGFFARQAGYYNIDIQVLSNGSCFASGNLRARIDTDPSSYKNSYGALQLLTLMMIGTGAVLVMRSFVRKFEEPAGRQEGLMLSPKPGEAYYSACRMPSKRLISALPQLGLLPALALSPCLVLLGTMYLARSPLGLPVSAAPPSAITKGVDGTEALVIRLKFKRHSGTAYYLNSKPLSVEELAATLKVELEGHSSRTVYIQGDDDVTFEDVANAVDMARGWKAKVVLITPHRRR